MHTVGRKIGSPNQNVLSKQLKRHVRRHGKNINTLIIAQVNSVLLRKQKDIPKVCILVMKRKQCELQLADLLHKEGMKRPHRILTRSGLAPVINSAAQMGAPQICNNSIKLTSLCFHRVRHTPTQHPLEFYILLIFTHHP